MTTNPEPTHTTTTGDDSNIMPCWNRLTSVNSETPVLCQKPLGHDYAHSDGTTGWIDGGTGGGMSEDIVTWLLGMLDEDEEVAPYWVRLRPVSKQDGPSHHQWLLADIAAKRRIVELHEGGGHECSVIRRGVDQDGTPYEEVDRFHYVLVGQACSTLRLLASAYSDRPGWQETWRPS